MVAVAAEAVAAAAKYGAKGRPELAQLAATHSTTSWSGMTVPRYRDAAGTLCSRRSVSQGTLGKAQKMLHTRALHHTLAQS